jgi:hypothetical protein
MTPERLEEIKWIFKGTQSVTGYKKFLLNADTIFGELLDLVGEQAAEIERQKELVEHLRDWCAAPCECEMPPSQLVEVEGVPV